jgi:hypothetical protein
LWRFREKGVGHSPAREKLRFTLVIDMVARSLFSSGWSLASTDRNGSHILAHAVSRFALGCKPRGGYDDTWSKSFPTGEREMKNVQMSVAGDILTITVDLTKEFGPSSSGKTIIIASTEGNVPIGDREEKIGLNVYRKK